MRPARFDKVKLDPCMHIPEQEHDEDELGPRSSVGGFLPRLGGAARRGTLSDEFTDMALQCADYIMVVEEGNDDGKFTDAATDAGIPITLLYTIADATTPLEEIFGTAAQ